MTGQAQVQASLYWEQALSNSTMPLHQNPATEKHLWQSVERYPEKLDLYIALLKYYFRNNRLKEALQVARLTLGKAAQMGGFSADWRRLQPEHFQSTEASTPARNFLFALKAMAFIEMRRGETATSGAILQKLAQLDPLDLVGASVIRGLQEKIQEE